MNKAKGIYPAFLVLSVLLSCILLFAAMTEAADRVEAINDSLDDVESFSDPQDASATAVEIVPVSVPPSESGDYDMDKFSARAADLSSQREKKNSSRERRMRLNPDKSKQYVIKKQLDDWDFSMRMGAGLRRDEFRWTIAGDTNGENPNMLSELIWRDISIYELGTKANVLWKEKIRLEGSLDYGWIVDGHNRDSDYADDNRQSEFSRSNSHVPGDNTLDASAGVGYEFRVPVAEEWKDFLTDDLRVVLLTGYSRREINLRMQEGFQDIPLTGPFAGLDSTYQAVWKGPWIGFEFKGERKRFSGFTRFEYHWADYHAGANWNLRSSFQHPTSYTHDADGNGYVLAFGGDLEFSKDWNLGLNIKYQDWETDAGLDRTYFSDGTTIDTQFNGAKWRSLGGMVTSTYHFSVGKPEFQENYAELK